MKPVPSVRPFLPHEWRIYRDLRLRALADSPDAFSRILAEEKDRPDTDWSSRLASGAGSRHDLPLVAEIREDAIGLAWGRIELSAPDVAHLYQMWVDPGFRRLGVGQMLLNEIIAWATAANAHYLDLGVLCGDSPATRLYSRTGFKPIGEPEPLRPGSTLLAQSMRLDLRRGAT